VEQAQRRITNAALPELDRASLTETLGQCEVEPAIPALIRLLGDKAKLQLAAIVALQNFREPAIGAALLDAYPKLSSEARTRTRSALASRPAWANQLVAAVEAGRIDAKEISTDLLRQMVRHDDAQLTASVEKRWGRLQPQSSAEKLSAINRLKLVLNPSGTTLRFKGDAAAGKVLFTQTCANCHRLFGDGNTLGPELTGSDRKNTEWLLAQTVDPSAFIRPEYVNHNVEMKDGRAFAGLIVEQTDQAVTIVDAQNQRTILSRAEIKELTPSLVSLMPDGLLEPFTPQQVRDLFSYLQTN
jgi:putative heme-binding domain-containing protein